MENNDLKENVRKKVKEKIAISNIRKEFDMKDKSGNKIIYGIVSVCAMFILCLVISKQFNFQLNTGIELSEDKNIIQNGSNATEDKIIFNEGSWKSMTDYDAKWIDADLKDEFNFIDKIFVPDGLFLSRQGKIFVRENINTDDYSKLKQYSLIYSTKSTEDPSYIEITFTKEQSILGCMIPDEKEIQDSLINGKKVKLSKGQYGRDKTKIVGDAFFEKDGYKFYIEAHKIDTEEDFINVVKSILNN